MSIYSRRDLNIRSNIDSKYYGRKYYVWRTRFVGWLKSLNEYWKMRWKTNNNRRARHDGFEGKERPKTPPSSRWYETKCDERVKENKSRNRDRILTDPTVGKERSRRASFNSPTAHPRHSRSPVYGRATLYLVRLIEKPRSDLLQRQDTSVSISSNSVEQFIYSTYQVSSTNTNHSTTLLHIPN